MPKTTSPKASVLTVRITAEYGLRIVGDAPDRHVFSADWVRRMVDEGHVRIEGANVAPGSTIMFDAVAYELVGYEDRVPGDPESGPNPTALIGEKV